MRTPLLLLVLIINCYAQTPEEAVRNYAEHVRTEGLAGMARLMHPDELVKFQSFMGPVIDVALSIPETQAQFAAYADPADPAQQRSFTPEEFMTLFFTWFEKLQPMIGEVLKNSTYEVLGHVREGEASHVVTRTRMHVQGLEIEKMTVISTREYQGRAMLMLSGEVKQLAETLKKSFESRAP